MIKVWFKVHFFGSIYTRPEPWWAHAFRHQSSEALLVLIIINVTSLCRLQTKLKPFCCIFILISLEQAYFPRLRWLNFTWTWFFVSTPHQAFTNIFTPLQLATFILTWHMHFRLRFFLERYTKLSSVEVKPQQKTNLDNMEKAP